MTLMKTPLHGWNAQHATMVPFAGYEMPVTYNDPSSITKEHMAVREAAGIFDVSHMGRMMVTGPDALKFLNLLVPRDLSKTVVGRVAYTYMLNEQAGFRDDLTVARMDENDYLVTWNAGNYRKIWHWVNMFGNILKTAADWTFEVEDITPKTAMIAFQGPKAPALIEKLFGTFPGSWQIAHAEYKGAKVIIMGSGYTGEDGGEITVLETSADTPKNALAVWEGILEDCKDEGVIPCGLGARDTLRTEAGMPLYGNDITEGISPVEAGLAFPPLVSLAKPFFVGKDLLAQFMDNPDSRGRRVGLLATQKGRAPRPGMKLFINDEEIGWVSSGVSSPLLKVGVGFGYVKSSVAVGTAVEARQDGSKKAIPLTVADFPLYDPDKYGKKRKQ